MNDIDLSIQTEEVQTDGKDTFDFHRYEPTSYEVLDAVFDAFVPKPEDVLVDYGCGLGRLNFYVERRFGIRTIGIEANPEYYERALKNLQSYNGNRDNISFLCIKAQDYEVSVSDTVFYFFNPFSLSVFRPVINQILLSWQEHPRTLTVLLYYPLDDVVYYMEQHTIFTLVDEIAASGEIRRDRRERFCIYQVSPEMFGGIT